MQIAIGDNADPRAGILVGALSGALERYNPENAVRASFHEFLPLANESGKIHVIGFGKAGLGMYRGLVSALPGPPESASIIVPHNAMVENVPEGLTLLRGSHPYPDRSSQESSERLLGSIEGLTEDDLVFVLVSGGSSSLFEVPVEGLSIERVSAVTKCLMEAGSDIFMLNAARRIMSRVKGGKLLSYIYPARAVSLIISDVPGDEPAYVGSGPTVEWTAPGHYADSDVLGAIAGCDPAAPEAISSRGMITGKAAQCTNRIVLRNSDVVKDLGLRLSREGHNVITPGYFVSGSVEELSQRILSMVREEFSRSGEPFWFVMGGESTSVVRGTGTGGRNQELVVRLALRLEQGEDCVFMSAGSDGIDGNSKAMGAVYYPGMFDGIPHEAIMDSLARSDAFPLLNSLGAALISGPTGNNVSDIIAGFYGGKGKVNE
ncbi:MAG: DUF4147 domain-containing protein [Candidatus Thermoplasmatota archaeon]|nr:DUF4147 domain-containing protein [Candidatus Thermoplasmatota archaeon]